MPAPWRRQHARLKMAEELRHEQGRAADASLPDVVVYAIGQRSSLQLGEGRSGKALPEVVEDEDLDLRLGRRVLFPVRHLSQQFLERREQGLAGLPDPL